MKILIYSAHCDDMETGMGGTAKLLKNAGHEIISIVTTLPPRDKRYEGFDEDAITTRKRESRKAHKYLGIDPQFLQDISEELNFPVTLGEREFFKKLFEKIKPDVVFTQWPVDVNPDHRSLGILSMEACLQKGVNTELFFYEVFSEPGRPQSLGFYPTHYVDIESVLGVKESMVKCHKSQSILLWKTNIQMQSFRSNEIRKAVNVEAFIRITRWGDLRPELESMFQSTPLFLPSGTGIQVDPIAIGLM